MNTKAATIPQPLAQPRHLAAPESQPSFRAIARPLIDIVVPVLNEEKILQKSITTLDEYMAKHLPYRYQITIADNGSQDKTLEIAKRLAEKYQSVRVVSLAERGRGRALKRVWQSSPADILTYMDVDLSTSLDDFLTMIQPLVAGEAGVAIGSRLMKDSRTSRGLKREFISRCYNSIIKWTSCTKFSDAQCGFKAIRRDVAAKFLPKIKDNEWFFDTELLIKTERAGVPIYEQPVTWIEDTDSRVKIVKTAVDDLKGLYRVNKELDNRSWFEKWLLPLLVGVTAVIAVMILGYAGTMTWLMWIVGLLGLTGMIGLLVNLYAPRRWLQNLAIITAIAACTLAPTVYTLATVNVAHTGSIPMAGPSSTAMRGSNNETSQANSQLVQYLLQHQNGATWLVAVASANESAAIQLTSGQPVMAVGGFNGSDTPLTLEQFKQLVKVGKVKYYAIGSHGRGGGGPGGGNNEIAAWVKQTGTVVNYGGSDVTLYELSRE